MPEKIRTYSKYTLGEDFWQAATERVNNAPIYKRSHRGKKANEVGFLGEIVVENWFDRHGIDYEDRRDSTELDYLINGRLKIEVKTKDRRVKPKLEYDNSVPEYNHDHQRPDYYIFVSLQRDWNDSEESIRRYKYAYIVGAISIEHLEANCQRWGAGDIDPSNGTEFWTSCFNVGMTDLQSIREMKRVWKSS